MLTLTPSGTVIKQTTEMQVQSLEVCEKLQIQTIFEKMPKNVRIISVICKTTGNDFEST